MLKLLVLDVDGTLTEKDRRIVPELVKAIPEVQRRGVSICLVSGNVIPVMYALKTYLGINGPVFGENGGIMLRDNQVSTFFSMETPKRFYEYLSGRIATREILTNRWRETSVAFESERELVLEELERMPEGWMEKVEVVDSTYAWHIMSRGQNKAYAVNRAMEIYNISGEDVLVCGDSDNDFAMYETEATKAALANSTDQIKEVSEYVSPKGHGSGIVEIFRHYGLL